MRVRRLATLALILVIAGGCRSWRAVPQPFDTPRVLAPQTRVIRTGGERVELSEGRLAADAVIGTTRGGPITIPRDSVARVEEWRPSWARSIGLILALYFGAAFAVSGTEALPLP